MNKKLGLSTLVTIIIVVVALLAGSIGGYYWQKQKNTSSDNLVKTTTSNNAINMGTDAFGEWSYQVVKGVFSIYLPQESTVDLALTNKFSLNGCEGIASITVPKKEKLEKQLINLGTDKWFQFSVYIDQNYTNLSLVQWIKNFTKNSDISDEVTSGGFKSELDESDMTDVIMVNKNITAKEFPGNHFSAPMYYAVKLPNNYIILFTGGQDPGTDSELARMVISTVKENTSPTL